MQIRVFEPPSGGVGFTIKAVTTAPLDVSYTETLTEIGAFSFKLPLSARNLGEYKERRFVLIDDVFWGVIRKIVYTEDAGGAYAEISGEDLRSLLRSRVTVPPETSEDPGAVGFDAFTGSTEECVKRLWESNIGVNAGERRQIPFLAVAALHSPPLGLANDKYMTRFEALDAVTRKILDAQKLGYTAAVDFAANTVAFDVFAGVNRTASQNENERVLFDARRGTVSKRTYERDVSAFKNAFYATLSGAEFEADAFTQVYCRGGAASGYDREEAYMTISANVVDPSEQYGELERLAVQQMTEFEEKESLLCEAAPDSGYREKWNVGDFVTLRWQEINKTLDAQVTAVNVSRNADGLSLSVKLGDGKPRLLFPRGNMSAPVVL
jgi:hypothetical protein